MLQPEKTPKVTVCVITYNQEKYIRQCLQSIVDQETDFDFEVIVGDDCSTDGTRDIVREFAERYPGIVKPIYQEKNIGGGVHNFLTVHRTAVGEYVAHVDGDDYWYPTKLSFQAAFLDNNPGIVQSWTCADLVDDNGHIKGVFPSRLARIFYPRILNTNDIALSYALVGQHSTQMYRREARKIELLIENPLDYWVAFINSLGGASFYSKRILSAYRIGKNDSITRTKKIKKITVDLLAEHLRQITELYPEYAEPAKANLVARRIASYIRGHDMSVIESNIDKLKKIPTNYLMVVRSLIFFLLQKMF